MVINVDNMGKVDLSYRAVLDGESLDKVKERRDSGRRNDRNRNGRDRRDRRRDNNDERFRGNRNRRSVGGYDGESRRNPPSSKY
jgi:predicted RNA-binding protein with RPS1 domain